MADEADIANDRAQEFLDIALEEARRKTLPDTGQCHNCGEVTLPGRRFCDADCELDYNKREKLKRITG